MQLPPQVLDAVLDQAAVLFQLLFAGAAQSHALFLPGKVRPQPFQPGHRVFQLCELDGQPRLGRLRPAGEDVENQLAAIQTP